MSAPAGWLAFWSSFHRLWCPRMAFACISEAQGAAQPQAVFEMRLNGLVFARFRVYQALVVQVDLQPGQVVNLRPGQAACLRDAADHVRQVLQTALDREPPPWVDAARPEAA